MNTGDNVIVNGRHGVVISYVYGFMFVVMDSGKIVLTQVKGVCV